MEAHSQEASDQGPVEASKAFALIGGAADPPQVHSTPTALLLVPSGPSTALRSESYLPRTAWIPESRMPISSDAKFC